MSGLLILQSAVFMLTLTGVVVRFTQLAERREGAWAQERAALINHIQSGERMPAATPDWGPREPQETDAAEFARVGQIDFAHEAEA